MASDAMATTKMLIILLALTTMLPLSTLASRSGPGAAHHGHSGHGHKHSSPPSQPAPAPAAATTTPPPPPPPPVATAAAALVRTTCNSTSYYDLCVSALGADPSSATADVRGLSTIAVSAAAANASGGAATATALANGTTTASANAQAAASTASDATVQALLRTCAAKYAQARDALAAGSDSIKQQDYDSASVHVTAAAEYPQVCKALFRRQRPSQYPVELAAREEALRQLCSVALDIIVLASNTSS